ncbi:hypothetical protein QDY28_21175 [Rhizobium sp. BR 362]
MNPPNGCKLSTRCPYAKPLCREVRPPLTGNMSHHSVASHFPLA